MFIAEKKLTDKWCLIEEVNTGDNFLIQNTTNRAVYFCVLDTTPDDSIIGGVLEAHQQLSFKKVTGDLFMRNTWGGNGSVSLYIEQVEA